MAFSTTHPDLNDDLTLENRDLVAEFARAESQFWAQLGVSGLHSADRYARAAQTEFSKLADAAGKEDTTDEQLEALLREIAPKYFLSSGSRGALLTSLKSLGHESRVVTAALTVLLKKPDEIRNIAGNSHWIYDCITGIAHVAAFESGGDPQRLSDLVHSITAYKQRWDNDLSSAEAQTRQNHAAHLAALDSAAQKLTEVEATGTRLVAKYEADLQEIREKFEEQFALRTPMTYWSEKAQRHRGAAKRYVTSFTTLLVCGVAVLAAIGYFSLFPLLRRQPHSYWALILFSVAIALLAWPLRMMSKQYLVHQELFEDASERAVIVQTFLALAEQVALTDADRQLLLGALLRPSSISLVSDDSGLNVADIILAKTLTKS